MDELQLNEWLKALQDGTATLAPIYRTYGKELFAYAYAIIQDADIANDAVSETMIRLCRIADRYKPDGAPKAYLFRVCKLVSLELRRRHRRDIPSDQLPEQAIEESEDSHLFAEQLLAGLSVTERQIMVLHYYEDMTFQQIAKVLQMPEGTVKWRHTKALKACRAFALLPKGKAVKSNE